MKTFLIVLTTSLLLFSCNNYKDDYVSKWEAFETNLIKKEKSFQSYSEFADQKGDFKAVSYTSDGMVLKGLLNTKNIDSLKKNPVIVYLHGGFALSYNEVERTKRFTDEGYIVFAPTYRGENGNPGYFELFMGEVQDAKAAINWIANKSYVDSTRIYVFGWSVGGGISLNLSLHNNLPIKLSSSSAGIYDYSLIKSWATEDDMIIFPYDYTNAKENYFRLSLYNLDKMVRTHFTYIGEEDNFKYYNNLVDSLYPNRDIKLNLYPLIGNHVSSLQKAMKKFINEIRRFEKHEFY